VPAHPNFIAILVSALAGFALGGIWYGPLFGKAWMRESGMTPEKTRSANMPKIYGTVLVLNLIAATSLAMFVGPEATWRFGLFAGFMTGLTFIATALGVIYLFESRGLRLWLINAGYQIAIFSVMGTILGAWH
jgi:predicted membrane protein